MHWEMICTGRHWCDFISYDPRLSPELQLFIKRVEYDPVYGAMLEKEVISFLKELDNKIEQLNQLKEKNGSNL
jgi:hypothetical protein